MNDPDAYEVGATIIKLMNGVMYRETHENEWHSLGRHLADVRDHFARIGIDVVVDEAEGYAFLRSTPTAEGETPLPRLVRRRALTYNVSLLLLLLRGRLAEFEAGDAEGKLVLERDQIVEMLRVFLADSTNEARVIDQVDKTIRQVADLGFLQELRNTQGAWEVRRIIKAYVDAETMSDFAARLEQYVLVSNGGEETDD